jgi:hypothetical protein
MIAVLPHKRIVFPPDLKKLRFDGIDASRLRRLVAVLQARQVAMAKNNNRCGCDTGHCFTVKAGKEARLFLQTKTQ